MKKKTKIEAKKIATELNNDANNFLVKIESLENNRLESIFQPTKQPKKKVILNKKYRSPADSIPINLKIITLRQKFNPW